MKKLFLCLLLAIFSFSLSGCSISEVNLFGEGTDAELMNTDTVSVSVGEKIDYYIKVNSHDDFMPEEIQCISENEGIATIEYRHILWESELHYYINGISSGETYIYFSSPDGEILSEKVKVSVLPKTESETVVKTKAISENKTQGLINTLYLKQGQTSNKFGFSVSTVDADTKNTVSIVSENPLVCTVLSDSLSSQEFIYFTVNATGEGTTYIYLTNKDGAVLSQKIQVTVSPSGISDTTTTEHSETVTTDDNVPVFITETTTAPVTVLNEIPETVYITPTGKKYHYKSTCAGKNAQAISFSDAKETYEPCRRCVHE